MNPELSPIDHVAIPVTDIRSAVDWYTSTFRCDVKYQDETWALLSFANIQLALVIPSQHPAHIGFVSPDAARFGELKTHRDGTRSVYIQDPAGNPVEVLASDSMPPSYGDRR
ncbi:MAG: VOC family protein [Acidobacteriota bacterium]|nr:VOC family protein [Acidobacteriota bacterium]